MAEKRLAYLEWIKHYTNNDFVIDGEEKIPAILDIVIEEMIAHDSSKTKGIQSQSLGDYSVGYNTSEYGYPKETLGKLAPFMELKSVEFV